jgi:putative oxidoreductase
MEGNEMTWKTLAVLLGRLIFACVFGLAVFFKLMGPAGTAQYIAAAGFPFPLFLTWCAVALELALVASFLTGAYMREMALIAGVYVIFLGFAFHGPNRWGPDQIEFGFFVTHFTFLAGLLFAAANGPGDEMAWKKGWLRG